MGRCKLILIRLVYYNDGHDFPVYHDRLRVTEEMTALARLAGIDTSIVQADNIRASVRLPRLKRGVAFLEENPVACRAEIIGGPYIRLLQFTRDYVAACEKYPSALIEVIPD